MIHICYGLYDKDGRYSKFVGTSIISIFENTNSDVTIHILHDNTFSEENRDKFNYMAGRYSQTIKFYNVEKLVPDKIAELRKKMGAVEKTKFSIGSLYRFLIPHIFSQEISKVIYLDADTIVNLDINELWQIELADKPFGAVAEVETDAFFHNERLKKNFNYLITENFVSPDDYFNSGVLFFNLVQTNKLEKTLEEGIIFFVKHPQFPCYDQDILNYCFSKEYCKLPAKFNAMIKQQRISPPPPAMIEKNFVSQEKIYHYVENKLTLDVRDVFNHLWFDYFFKTPWFNVDTIGHFYESCRRLYIEQKNFAVQVSKFVAGKKRVFFVEQNYIDAVKNIFGIEDSEEIISANDSDSLKKLTEILREGNNFLFILVNNYPNVHLALEKNGFTLGKDFINAWMFLSDAHGVPLDSYSIVRSL